MSLQGIILIDILCLGLIVLMINLLRTRKLHVGYALIWIAAICLVMVIVSVPTLLETLPRLVGAVYPASALSLLAFLFIFLVLVFVSVKLSQLSSRQVEIIQLLAMKALEEESHNDSTARDSHTPDNQS